jgi:hypothetical protein
LYADRIPDEWGQQYSAGSNPTNFDPFAISHCEFTSADNQDVLIRWDGVSGRVYNIYWTSNLLSGFTLLQTNVSWESGSFTDTTHQTESCGYYKLDVELAP